MSSKDDKKATRTQTNRLPAPALFVGPPSHNASNTSLHETRASTKIPLVRQRSLLSPDSKRPLPPNTTNDGDHLSPVSTNPKAPFQRRQRQQSQAADAEASSRAEAIWAEMQNTLEEVELSAIRGPGMTVFGSEHSRALDELRKAQIELAKAWARSEEDEQSPEQQQQQQQKKTKAQDSKAIDFQPQSLANPRDAAGAGKGDKLFDKIKLEEETEKDIELSRKRREENDRYFEKVNKGVQEVVVRLEEVAKAMRGVESESKEIWGHASDDTESITTAQSVT